MNRSAIAQINVRLPLELKESGDRGLRDLGLSPTDVVRALWRRLAERGESLEKIESLLFEDERTKDDEVSSFGKSPIAEGWRLVDEGLREIGVSARFTTAPAQLDDNELLTQALEERMRERGLM